MKIYPYFIKIYYLWFFFYYTVKNFIGRLAGKSNFLEGSTCLSLEDNTKPTYEFYLVASTRNHSDVEDDHSEG